MKTHLKKVLMLANNPVTHDTRVIKCAESLASRQFDVTVLCRQPDTEPLPHISEKNDVTYERWQFVSTPLSLIKKLLPIFVKNPKKLTIFPLKTLSLLTLLIPVVICTSILLYPFSLLGLLPLKPNRALKLYPVHKVLLNSLFNHTLQHTYITLQTFASLYEPLRAHNADIIHAHDIDTVLLGAVVAGEQSIPYIYDVHEYERDRIDRRGLINRWLIKNDENKYIQKAHVITVSEGIASLLARNYGIKKPVVVYNAPKLSEQTTDESAVTIRDTLKLDKTSFIVVYVGLITINRSLENIINTLEHTKDVHFAFVGPQYQPMVDKLNSMAAAMKKSEYLHILPAVSYAKVTQFISTANAGIIILDNLCQSYQHAMPNKFFETMCAGLPMIISDQAEMKAVLEQHQNGVTIKRNTPLEIAHAIQTLRTDEQRFKPSAEKVQALRAHYSWEAQEEKLFATYKQIETQENATPSPVITQSEYSA